MRNIQEEQLYVLFIALYISSVPAAAEVNPEAKQRSADLFGTDNYVVAAQSFPDSYQRSSTLNTEYLQIHIAGVISMNQALELGRNCYNIDEKAYNQLRILLMSRQSPEIAYFTDRSYANLLPTRSVLNHQSIISPGLFETDMINEEFSNIDLIQDSFETNMANEGFSNTDLGPGLLKTGMANGEFSNADLGSCLLETDMTNEGISNGSLGRGQDDAFSTSIYELDFLGLTSNERLNESPGNDNFYASNELDNVTVQSTTFVTTQSNQESLSRSRLYIGYGKKKLEIYLFIAGNVL